MTARRILEELERLARDDKADFLPRFFQAFPGGYGEGDKFLGVVVPDQRKVARRNRDLPRRELERLLASRWHECRLTGFLILVLQFERARNSRTADPKRADEIVRFYMEQLEAANNWDLVDATAPKILGPWLLDHPGQRKRLRQLASSDVIWRRRVAVLATYPLIRDRQFDEILDLADRLLNDPHELMHKAIGWMLREVWKQDADVAADYLETQAVNMPRIMLRYAIEKMPKSERDEWLAR